jgi:leader peptidase (prepilin peptidase)/N-methyltransferase
MFLALLGERDLFVMIGFGIFGLMIGSFLAVVIVRLPVMLDRRSADTGEAASGNLDHGSGENLSLIRPRSHCPHCKHQLRWHENIPVASYLVLRAKCPDCKVPISALYPVVELLTCLAAIMAAIWFGNDGRLIGALVLSLALIPLVFIDMRHFLLPDDIVLPVLWLGLMCNVFEIVVPLKDAVLGAASGYLVLWSIYWCHRTLTGKEGMGYGDFKLAAMLGAWLGVGLMPVILILAFASGALVGVGLMIAGRATGASAIPFGPFLAMGGWISLYWGEAIIEAYWGITLPW